MSDSKTNQSMTVGMSNQSPVTAGNTAVQPAELHCQSLTAPKKSRWKKIFPWSSEKPSKDTSGSTSQFALTSSNADYAAALTKIEVPTAQEGESINSQSQTGTAPAEITKNPAVVQTVNVDENSVLETEKPVPEKVDEGAAPPKTAEATAIAAIAELWNEAWEQLKEKDCPLVKEYEKRIESASSSSTKSHTVISAMATTHSSVLNFSGLGKIQRAQMMKVLLQERIDKLDNGRWKIGFRDHQFAVKDVVEPVVRFIDWAKDFMGKAAEASPYASLTWAGLSCLLSVVLNPGKQEAARAKGLEHIAALLRQCSIREALYSHSYDHNTVRKNETLPVHVSYREELKILYVKILKFQATCFCHLTKGTTSMTIRDITAWDKWDALVAEIDLQSDNVKSIEEQWRDLKLQERWKIETDQHEENIAKLAPIADEISRIRTVIEKTQRDIGLLIF